MWPSTPAFRSSCKAACPAGATCELPFCIFDHDAVQSSGTASLQISNVAQTEREPEPKRLKLTHDSKESNMYVQTKTEPNVFVGSILSKEKPKATVTQSPKSSVAASNPQQIPALLLRYHALQLDQCRHLLQPLLPNRQANPMLRLR